MKIQKEDTTVISSGKERSQMSMVSNAQAFRVLSDTMYEHKIMAVVRELSSNANDSHTDAGQTRPFRYTLPNAISSIFAVEDFGIGLDDEGVRRVMFSYFNSTKDEDDAATGCLGLGSKSPLAYTDAFTITARKDGMERVYTSYWGEKGIPELDRVFMRPTTEPNGVRIEIPVQNRDFDEFTNAATFMSRMFDTTPEFVGASPNAGIIELLDGFADKVKEGKMFSVEGGYRAIPPLYRDDDVWVVMGSVVYPTGSSSIVEMFDRETRRMLHTRFGRNGRTLVIPVEMGGVDFSASRETLSLTPRTKNALKTAVSNLVDEMIDVGQSAIREDHSPVENAILAQRAILAKSGLAVNTDEFIAWMRKTIIPTGKGTSETAWELINSMIPLNYTRLLLRCGLTRFHLGRRGTYSDGHIQMQATSYSMNKFRKAVDPDDENSPMRTISSTHERLFPRTLMNTVQSQIARGLGNRDEVLSKKIPVFYATNKITAHRQIIRDHLMPTTHTEGTKVHHLGCVSFLKEEISQREIETIKKILGTNLFEYHDISAIHAEQKERRKQERAARGKSTRNSGVTPTIRGDANLVRSPWFRMSATSPRGILRGGSRGGSVMISDLQKSEVIDTTNEHVFYVNPYDDVFKTETCLSRIMTMTRASSVRECANSLRRSIGDAIDTSNVFTPSPISLNGVLIIATSQTLKRLENSSATDITSFLAVPDDLVILAKSVNSLPREVEYEPECSILSERGYRAVNTDALATFMEKKREEVEIFAPHLRGAKFVNEARSVERFILVDERMHNVFPQFIKTDGEWRKELRNYITREYPILAVAMQTDQHLYKSDINSHIDTVDRVREMRENTENKGDS